MQTLRTLAFATVAAAALLVPRAAPAGTEPEEPPTPTVLPATEEEVAILLEHAELAVKEKDDEKLAAVLLDMESRSHGKFVPIIAAALDHKDAQVQARAIRAAASNGMEDEAKHVLKLLKGAKKSRKGKSKDEGDVSGFVAAAAIDFVARLAVEGAEEEVVEHLTRLFQVESRMTSSYAPDLVRAAVHYLGQTKYKKAVPQLVDLVKEPYPEDPNSGTNPPESYWKARYAIWQASEGWVRWALKEITGQQFRTHREWQAWLSANEKDYK